MIVSIRRDRQAAAKPKAKASAADPVDLDAVSWNELRALAKSLAVKTHRVKRAKIAAGIRRAWKAS